MSNADIGQVVMAAHGYGLRSKTAATASSRPGKEAAPTAELLADPEDILLRTTSDRRGGLLSTRPAPKKIKATSGETILALWNYDPCSLSDLKDLTDLEDEPLHCQSQPQTNKRRRSVVPSSFSSIRSLSIVIIIGPMKASGTRFALDGSAWLVRPWMPRRRRIIHVSPRV